MIISKSIIRGLRTDLEKMIPFLVEYKVTFIFDSEHVEIMAYCGTTLIEAISQTLGIKITVDHTFTNKSITHIS